MPVPGPGPAPTKATIALRACGVKKACALVDDLEIDPWDVFPKVERPDLPGCTIGAPDTKAAIALRASGIEKVRALVYEFDLDPWDVFPNLCANPN